MKIDIAENIRRFRKTRRITQEQLAEAMGVTVGAVSKWETGASVPDIELIIALAELFETSVDTLLGYGLEKGGMKRLLSELEEKFRQKQFDEAASLAEKLLLKYPNSFDVVHKCALIFNMKGLEMRSNPDLGRALELYERSMELVGQNTAERVNEWSLRNAMARVYLSMGEWETGLDMLKANNAEGVNDADIGGLLAREEGCEDEAMDYLSGALMSNVMKLVNIMDDLSVIYEKRGEPEKAQDAYRWACSFVGSLILPGETGFLNHVLIGNMAGLAVCLYRMGDIEQASNFLSAAKEKARVFDAEPDYSMRDMRFYESADSATGFTDFGIGATESIRRHLMQQEEAEELMELWNRI